MTHPTTVASPLRSPVDNVAGTPMSGLPADARRDLPLALVAAATTWITMLSWRGYSACGVSTFGPLLLVAVIVAVGGVLFRSAPLPRRWRCCSTSWSSRWSCG